MGVLRRRRERQEFAAEVAAAVVGVRLPVQARVADADALLDAAVRELAALPGAAARCPNCSTRMALKRVKDGRKWWTLWVCSSCESTYRPADFSVASRAGGWK